MSKGLEELKRLAYENACCRCQYYIDKKCTNNYECVWKTIEEELKENERLKTSYPENLLNEGSKEYIYKKLKALEIIKDKKVCIDSIVMSPDLNSYNKGCVCEHYLTQEEYELLKEVLL